MSSKLEARKEALAINIVQVYKDAEFKRITREESEQKMKLIMHEAKLLNISPNELLEVASRNENTFVKILEKRYQIPYSSSFTNTAA